MILTSPIIQDIEVEHGTNGISLSQNGDNILMSEDQLKQFMSAELLTLREAGEKMKDALEDIKLGNYLYGADIEIANTALGAWEAANK